MKAQVSIEYLMVIGLLLTVMLPATYYFYQYSESSSDQISSAQIETFGRAIAINAAGVYRAGEPSRMTIQGRLPDNVVWLGLNSDWSKKINEVVFVTKSSEGELSEHAYPSKVNLDGFFYPRNFAGGVKSVLLEAYKKSDGTVFVFVNFDGRCPASSIFDLDGSCLVDTADLAIFDSCLLPPQNRTTGVWNDRWNTCMQADYDGDCIITNTDQSILLPHMGDVGCAVLKANGAPCIASIQCFSLVCGTDADGDGYFNETLAQIGTCQPSSKPYTDCLDSNSAVHPGQTAYFATPADIPTNSFDYDCDGADTLEYDCSVPLAVPPPPQLCYGDDQGGMVGWAVAKPSCGTNAIFQNCTIFKVNNCNADPQAVSQLMTCGSCPTLAQAHAWGSGASIGRWELSQTDQNANCR